MDTIGQPEGWSAYELLGLMHHEIKSLGVRLDDVLNPVIRIQLPLSPEKSKVLFWMVDALDVQNCRELCHLANLYHLTISQIHLIP